MPGFDPEIGKLAQRVLINPRKIDYHTGVFASKVKKGYCFSMFFKSLLNSHLYFLLPFPEESCMSFLLLLDYSGERWKTSFD